MSSICGAGDVTGEPNPNAILSDVDDWRWALAIGGEAKAAAILEVAPFKLVEPPVTLQRLVIEWAPVAKNIKVFSFKSAGDERGAVNDFTFSMQRRNMVVVKARTAVNLCLTRTACCWIFLFCMVLLFDADAVIVWVQQIRLIIMLLYFFWFFLWTMQIM